MIVTLNTTTQLQNITTVSNIFNLTSQLIGTATEVTAERSGSQNNMTGNVNTRGEHFPHFGIIRANLLKRYEAFGGNNNNLTPGNNNNNNPLSPLPLLEFGGGLGGGFNLLPGENTRRLDQM